MNETINRALLEFKEKINSYFSVSCEMVLFGSTARNEAKEYSDIDILVLLPLQVTNSIEEKVIHLALEIELKYDLIFGIIVYENSFWNSNKAFVMPIHKNISHDGIRI
jgi:predicted nucleotidyltransferase